MENKSQSYLKLPKNFHLATLTEKPQKIDINNLNVTDRNNFEITEDINSEYRKHENPDYNNPDYITSKTLNDLQKEDEIMRKQRAMEEAIELINQDEAMNDQEKKDAIETFQKEGYI